LKNYNNACFYKSRFVIINCYFSIVGMQIRRGRNNKSIKRNEVAKMKVAVKVTYKKEFKLKEGLEFSCRKLKRIKQNLIECYFAARWLVKSLPILAGGRMPIGT